MDKVPTRDIKHVLDTLKGMALPSMQVSFLGIGAYYLVCEPILKVCTSLFNHLVRPRKDFSKIYTGKWALVTGATGSIGQALCSELAKAGLNLILVSKDREKLEVLSNQLKRTHNVETVIIPHDFSNLSDSNQADVLTNELERIT